MQVLLSTNGFMKMEIPKSLNQSLQEMAKELENTRNGTKMDNWKKKGLINQHMNVRVNG